MILAIIGTTTAAVIAGVGAALGAGATVYSAERQASGQRKALRAQEEAQRAALAQANKQARQSEEQFASANKKTPDMSAIMASAATGSRGGAASTNLTGTKTTTLLGE